MKKDHRYVLLVEHRCIQVIWVVEPLGSMAYPPPGTASSVGMVVIVRLIAFLAILPLIANPGLLDHLVVEPFCFFLAPMDAGLMLVFPVVVEAEARRIRPCWSFVFYHPILRPGPHSFSFWMPFLRPIQWLPILFLWGGHFHSRPPHPGWFLDVLAKLTYLKIGSFHGFNKTYCDLPGKTFS